MEFSEKTEEQLLELFKKRASYILISHTNGLPADSKEYAPLLEAVRATGEKGGRIVLEPLYMGVRGASPLFIKDVFSVSYNIVTRIKDSIKYRHTDAYHAKVIFHPSKKTVLYTYFMHRNAGDPCAVLISNCTEVPYLNSQTFDLMLEQALREGHEDVRISFKNSKAVLPEGTIKPSSLGTMSDSVRIYKWLVAAEEAEKVPVVRKRFIGAAAVFSLLDISFMAYDAIKAIAMYKSARPYRATIFYQEKNIESIVFRRPPTDKKH